MKKRKVRYFIEEGHLYCDDGIFDKPYEVECSVEEFKKCLKTEGFLDDKEN